MKHGKMIFYANIQLIRGRSLTTYQQRMASLVQKMVSWPCPCQTGFHIYSPDIKHIQHLVNDNNYLCQERRPKEAVFIGVRLVC